MNTVLGIDLPTWWFLLIGALISGYGILDGFDLGAGALHLFFQKSKVDGLRSTPSARFGMATKSGWLLVQVLYLPLFHSYTGPSEAASSDGSLRTMLLFAAIGMPLVATYTVFMFWTFRRKVKLEEHSY